MAAFSLGAQGQSKDVSFHIPAKPIAEALVDLALQAKLSIGYVGVDFHADISNPVEGHYPPEEALRLLLAGTGYEFVQIDADTVRIRRAVLAPPAPIAPAPIEEVIVTATKREQAVQSLPYSIGVARLTELDELGLHSTKDLTTDVASLFATNLGASQEKLTIRGLSDGPIAGHSQSMVGVYLDEALLTDNAPDPDLRLVDVNRVEVVRGPQGTLYGAGALGGIVRIVTNKPALDRNEGMFATSTAATESGGMSWGADAMLNLPISRDVLALRAVGYVRRDGGYIDDIRLHRRDINRTDTQGARIGLRWQAAEDWSLTTTVTEQWLRAADSQYAYISLGGLRRANFISEPHLDRFLQAGVTVEGALDWARLTSTTALTERRIANQFDATRAWAALTGFRPAPSTFDSLREIESITHETRLASVDSGRLSWLAGAIFSHREEQYQSSLVGPDASHAPYLARAEARKDRSDEGALFGEVTYRLTDWLSLTGGARWFRSSIGAKAKVTGANQPANPFARDTNGTTGFIPKFVLAFRPQDNLMLYVSASEGFRLGGININSPPGAINIRSKGPHRTPSARVFNSDQLWTYETGIKANLLGGHLVGNAAIFENVWDYIQTDQFLRDGSLFTANVGNVHETGFEVDFDLRLTPRLSLKGNYFWSHQRFRRPNPTLIQSRGRLPVVPDSTFGLSAIYDLFIGEDWSAVAALEYAYVGEASIGFDERHSPKMDDYAKANLRLTLISGPWKGALFVDNLFNAKANTFAFGNPFSFAQTGVNTPLRPRSIGFDLGWTF